jgi:UV DNA damage endonuclease
MELGYACINMELSYPTKEQKKSGIAPVTTNRSMIKRTFLEKGINYASELSYKNVQDLVKVIQWNIDNGIKFFRMSSDVFPWASEYNLQDLPDYDNIKERLQTAGQLARDNGVRLSFHPGPFNVLTSPRENVVKNTVKDLSTHGEIMDLLGAEKTPYNKINIHIGGAYGDKEKSMERFCKNFEMLPESVQTRLTVENDDKGKMYSAKDLYYGVFERIGIPIVFDYHHHKFCTGGLSEEDALGLSTTTWKNITPATHYSESRADEHNDQSIRGQAHSDFVYKKINTYDFHIDVMVEAKMKEKSVQKYKELYGIKNNNTN